MGFLVFGLTGGIASGKSSVAERWRSRGVPVVDADALARDVVAPGSEGLFEIVKAFGEGVLLADGSLDRKALAAIAFADEAARRTLEAITHPRIAAAGMAKIAEAAAAGHPLACYEAALLVERGIADGMRPLVVVAAPEDVQVTRAMARDGSTADEALARIRAQLPMERKVAAADYVIENSGTRDALLARADEVLDEICRKAGVDPSRYPARDG